MNQDNIIQALQSSDEFLMILTSKTDAIGTVDVNIILGCDLTGNMIGLLERALADIKDAAKQRIASCGVKAQGDGYQIHNRPAKNRITAIASNRSV